MKTPCDDCMFDPKTCGVKLYRHRCGKKIKRMYWAGINNAVGAK